MIALLLLAGLLVAGLLFEQVGEFLDARRYPPSGQRIDLPGGARLHIYSQGDVARPAVVFESGISGSSLSWASVQPLVAEFAHAVSYDRNGLGWSEGSPTPRTVANMVSELAALLDAAHVTAPYVLVGHSFGGILVQAFAHTYPDRTAALVMVDPVAQTEWANPDAQHMKRIKMGARLARRGALLARFGVVRAALSLLIHGGRRIPQLVARASAGQGNSAIERLITEVRKLPSNVQPIVAAFWSRGTSFGAMATYLECLTPSARSAVSMPVPPQIPLVVLSAANATPQELAEREAWVASNPNRRHIKVEGTGHWLQLDRPELVAEVVRQSLTHIR